MSAAPDYLLAHDLGTTGDKATIFEAGGSIAASVTSSYPTFRPTLYHVEQDPESWWRAFVAANHELSRQAPEAMNRLAAISFSGMMNGCLLVDARGNPLGRAMIHADSRSGADCDRIGREFGYERAYDISGNHVAPFYTLGKLAWQAREAPDVVASARWLVQAKEYVLGKLTGIWGITDRSDASLTGCFDMRRGAWSTELVEAGGFPARLLPELRPSTSIVARLSRSAAAECGLSAGIPVILGGGDGACATAGAGAVSGGGAYHYLGGTSWIAATTTEYRPDPTRRLSVLCGLDDSLYVVYGTVQSACLSLDWFRRAVGAEQHDGEDEYSAVERQVQMARPGCSGLLFLPYLEGERAPIWDSSARGVFFGIRATHGKAELARAVLEGVALAMGTNLQALADMGLALQAIRVLGSGMRMQTWRRIFAAVYNRPIVPMTHLTEATSCGAAMAAAVGAGIYTSFREAAQQFAIVDKPELPVPEMAALYAKLAPLFGRLYRDLAAAFGDLAALKLD